MHILQYILPIPAPWVKVNLDLVKAFPMLTQAHGVVTSLPLYTVLRLLKDEEFLNGVAASAALAEEILPKAETLKDLFELLKTEEVTAALLQARLENNTEKYGNKSSLWKVHVGGLTKETAEAVIGEVENCCKIIQSGENYAVVLCKFSEKFQKVYTDEDGVNFVGAQVGLYKKFGQPEFEFNETSCTWLITDPANLPEDLQRQLVDVQCRYMNAYMGEEFNKAFCESYAKFLQLTVKALKED